MTVIKRKTLTVLLFVVLALLVAQGCQNSSASVPADSASSAVVDTNVSTSASPDTTDPVPNVGGDSDQIAYEPTDSEPTDSEPAGSEPTDSEPAGSEPTDSEPAGSEPTDNEPAGSEPTDNEPAGSESTDSEPTPDISADGESATDINEETPEYIGSVTYFWTPSCEGCVEGLRQVQKLYDKYGDQFNFVGFFTSGIDNDTPEAHRIIKQETGKIIADEGITFPNLLDSKMLIFKGSLNRVRYEPREETEATFPAYFVRSPHVISYSVGRQIDPEGLESSISRAMSKPPIIPDPDFMPNIVGETFDHGTFDLHSSFEKASVIFFWNSSCEACIEDLRSVQTLYEGYQDRVNFIGVFVPEPGDDEQTARQVIADQSITFPNLADSDLDIISRFRNSRSSDMGTLPLIFMIKADLSRKFHWEGPRSPGFQMRSLERLLADSD